MDFDKIKKATQDGLNWLGEVTKGITEGWVVSKDLRSLIRMVTPPNAPNMSKVQSKEDLDKWMSTPENKQAYDDWLMGMIPDTGLMLKADALKQWATTGAEYLKNVPLNQKKEIIKSLQSAYGNMKAKLGQEQFDWIDSLRARDTGMAGVSGTYSPVRKEIVVSPKSSSKDIVNVLFHEFTHGGHHAGGTKLLPSGKSYDVATAALFEDLTSTRNVTKKLVDEGVIDSYNEMSNLIYHNYDPTEAMARAVGREMSVAPNKNFIDVFEAYLDKYTVDREAGKFSVTEDYFNFENYFKDLYKERMYPKPKGEK